MATMNRNSGIDSFENRERIIVSLYENAVPPFVGPELVSLYAHVYSSPAHFSIYGGMDGGTHTYVVHSNGKVAAVLLFRIENGIARVLNEQISPEEREIERFVRHVFDAYESVDVVAFGAIQADAARLPFPVQHFYRTEDIVVRLPGTPEQYMAALGKATRKNIRKHWNRLDRQFPSLRFDVYLNEDIGERHVSDVVALNRARMSLKNKQSEIDEDEIRRLTSLVRHCGMACIMTMDGQTCAGAICSRVGDNFFMHIGAHHPDHDELRLGTICCVRTICESIERGAKEFHFMWGRFDYKYALLGVRRDYEELLIYRSPARLLRHGRLALQTMFSGYRRELKFRLLEIADGKDGGLGFRLLNWLRDMKQGRIRLAAPRH